MKDVHVQLLLADDDQDDCALFIDALEELNAPARLTTVHDGEQLMLLLDQPSLVLPDVLFLDLNMPRKNGFECLSEIRDNKKLKELPVIILSTSNDADIIDKLQANGARHYIRKPNDFEKLKKVIANALLSVTQPAQINNQEHFILSP